MPASGAFCSLSLRSEQIFLAVRPVECLKSHEGTHSPLQFTLLASRQKAAVAPHVPHKCPPCEATHRGLEKGNEQRRSHRGSGRPLPLHRNLPATRTRCGPVRDGAPPFLRVSTSGSRSRSSVGAPPSPLRRMDPDNVMATQSCYNGVTWHMENCHGQHNRA